ncbi:GAF and ANTAR domain-containing protein [Aeromicrobium sp.]|uniref:GAF and ANTAR domain-containing protein n=1 Tax=Aeromicrobium sp. TaxID=1871063 RepID=UPI0019ACEB03|nr:GAF and ANTAR domain-containing protein [Aeromicrobium sp.]MBC7630385.1 GAF and ANTAR domain-containing protein [Aeromicrobium sp.]
MNGHEQPGTDEISSHEAALDPGTDLAGHLADIATVLLAPGAVTAAERIVSLASQTMDSCDDAGLCDASTQRSHLVPSALMAALERLQTDVGQGPCADALGGLALVYVPDLLDDQRWPLFSPAAARLGMRSALAYRLQVEGETLGALQLYAHLPGAFNARERAQGLIFATYAALALTLARDRQAEESRIENLQTALTSREIIGQAQGILMERERITADQAFQLLRLSSQHLNRKLRDVAQYIVDTGTIGPEATRK